MEVVDVECWTCAIGVSFLSLALHHFFWLPWSIQEGMVASLFATVGYSISLEKVKQNRILVCCVAILYLLFCLFSGSQKHSGVRYSKEDTPDKFKTTWGQVLESRDKSSVKRV